MEQYNIESKTNYRQALEKIHINTEQTMKFNSIYLHANLTAKGQLQSEHVKKYRNDTQ
jgi:hypothetical protein